MWSLLESRIAAFPFSHWLQLKYLWWLGLSKVVSRVRKATQNRPKGHLLGKWSPAPCHCLCYPGEGDVSGRSLCLELELECLIFGSELSNSLKELLITCCMSADFTSHDVSGVTSRGSCSRRFLGDQMLEVVVLIWSLEVALLSFHVISEVEGWRVGSEETADVVTVREGTVGVLKGVWTWELLITSPLGRSHSPRGEVIN